MKILKKTVASIVVFVGILSLHAVEHESVQVKNDSAQEDIIDIMGQLPPELQEQIVFELLNDKPEKALQNLRNVSLVSTSYATMLKSDRVKSKRVRDVTIQKKIHAIITQPGPNWKIVSETNKLGEKPLVQDFMKSSKNQQWLKDIMKKHRPSMKILSFEPEFILAGPPPGPITNGWRREGMYFVNVGNNHTTPHCM